MPKPKYEPRCAVLCTDRWGNPRLGTEWIHIDGMTLYVCAACARAAFDLPSPSTLARRRLKEMRQFQGVLPDA